MWRMRANTNRQAHGSHPVGPRAPAPGTDRRLVARLSTLDSTAGFTLVEMLVAVALVVLMMSMFATVFGLAAGSIDTQRGIAENDQRARSVTTVIRGDLEARSFKNVIPWDADEGRPNGPPLSAPPGDREGYFYISENEPTDDADDVLQFTVKLPGTTGDFYFGRAESLHTLTGDPPTTAYADSNEPDRDDGNPLFDDGNGNLVPDNSSESVAAEVSYFLRHGRLYRRVLLLRAPLDGDTNAIQPTDNSGQRYFNPANDGQNGTPNPYTGNLWNDFDFSAHSTIQFDQSGDVSDNGGARLHGVVDLDNSGSKGVFPLGVPSNRFGHNHVDSQPREYADGTFIGRFTHEETSHADFQYPQAITTSIGNPMDRSTTLNVVDGVVDEFRGGPRRAEDLLLSNVHSFDVKVWDDALDRFVDVGHDISGGDYNQANNRHANPTNPPQGVAKITPVNYGPHDIEDDNRIGDNRIFDTWHPNINLEGGFTVDTPGNPQPPAGDQIGNVNDPPPFRPLNSDGTPRPLRAVQITIRYLDIASNQLRQLTLQVSLIADD